MPKNKQFRAFAMTLFALPLLIDFRYFIRAWQSSPLDHYQWIWWCVVVVLPLVFFRRIRRWAQPLWRLKNAIGWVFFALSFIAMAYGAMRSIHAVYLMGALSFIFSGVYILYGERLFSGISPLFIVSLLGVPSTTFWFTYYIHGAGLSWGAEYVKPLVGIIASIIFCLTRKPLRIDKLLFVGFLLLLGAFSVIRTHPMLKGDCFTINFDVDRKSGWLCERMEMELQDEIVFNGADVKQFLYMKNGQIVTMSSIKPAWDIHSLHPVEICLRSGGDVIEKSEEVILEVHGQRIAVLESLVLSGDIRYLIYTTYVGPEWSSGNFMAFRHHWRPKKGWICYQAMTPIWETVEDTQKLVIDLLKTVVQ
ncbi:MAG: hypothetical protein IKP58_11405 [Victivallales bacterium]|nr:hypothetical protein [Victivallales bacterium]